MELGENGKEDAEDKDSCKRRLQVSSFGASALLMRLVMLNINMMCYRPFMLMLARSAICMLSCMLRSAELMLPPLLPLPLSSYYLMFGVFTVG